MELYKGGEMMDYVPIEDPHALDTNNDEDISIPKVLHKLTERLPSFPKQSIL
uniref:AlNc14C63G4534 protein n=1 Tax=Albugo laibachii Nc14 TaxID=890382 RepID=F0WD10_9STRA|nr:AlNc14C63G4534 [Albugo laibachii Nc14]|eukprot:CCA19082.1 AlNc14C63G4534 [Albugo laibachii Nc14]